MANFCCSIETEPRTLNEGQLSYAREIAVDIIQKKETNEASTIFYDGKRPIISIKEMEMEAEAEAEPEMVVVAGANQMHKMAEEYYNREPIKEQSNIETYCQCLSSAVMESSPQMEGEVKEPLSAPF